jgi:membrane-bound lytic murein transglycosylase D
VRKNREQDLPTDFWSLDLPRETRRYVPRLLAIAAVVRDPQAHGLELEPIANAPRFVELDVARQVDLSLAASLADIDPEELRRLNPGLLRSSTDPNVPHTILVPPEKAEVLAARLDGAHTALQRATGLEDSRVRADQTLAIPDSAARGPDRLAAAESPPPAAAPTRRSRAAEPVAAATHVVRPGETLWDIARTHKVNRHLLAEWNGLTPHDVLRPGQTLRLVARLPDQSSQAHSYRVVRGDSLYRIARRFGVTVRELRRWNALSGSALQPGQLLKLYPRTRVTTAL